VNRAKTKIQRVKDRDPVPQVIHVGSSQVEVVGEFIYLGACTIHDGSSESEILRRRIGIARNCMTLLEKHGSHISETKVTLYGVYVLLVLMCGSEVWSVIKSLAILGDLTLLIHNVSVKSLGSRKQGTLPTIRQTTGCPPVSQAPYPRETAPLLWARGTCGP